MKLEFDNHIQNIDELIEQLESLKIDAFKSMRSSFKEYREVFVKDHHALRIVINLLKEMKENGKY